MADDVGGKFFGRGGSGLSLVGACTFDSVAGGDLSASTFGFATGGRLSAGESVGGGASAWLWLAWGDAGCVGLSAGLRLARDLARDLVRGGDAARVGACRSVGGEAFAFFG